MQPQFVEEYLSKKLNENNNIIVFTFYELRIKTNQILQNLLLMNNTKKKNGIKFLFFF